MAICGHCDAKVKGIWDHIRDKHNYPYYCYGPDFRYYGKYDPPYKQSNNYPEKSNRIVFEESQISSLETLDWKPSIQNLVDTFGEENYYDITAFRLLDPFKTTRDLFRSNFGNLFRRWMKKKNCKWLREFNEKFMYLYIIFNNEEDKQEFKEIVEDPVQFKLMFF